MATLRSFLVNFSYILSLFREFWSDMRAQKRRTMLTIFGIVWGTAAVVIMMAVGTSVKRQNMTNFRGLGDAIILVFPGTTTKPFQGFGVNREIRLQESDVDLLRAQVPEINQISEEYARYDGVLRYGTQVKSPLIAGVNVEYGDIRNEIPSPGGRWFDEQDLADKRRVIFLGDQVGEFLFGKGVDPVGEFLFLNGVSFRVIGVLRPKVQNSSYNYRDTERAFIPSTTYVSMFGERYINNIVITHRLGTSNSKAVVKRIRTVLGSRYTFDPEDEDALGVWDTAEFFEIFIIFFTAFNIFLVAMGAMTLGVGGLGVSNIMYVVVRERTREIGIKRAVGARKWVIMTQFFAETFFITFVGAVIGFLIAWGMVAVAGKMPASAKEALGTPAIDPLVALVSVAIISFIAFLAGYFPARKAANLDPIECLRY
jgi:putative ABC transport system permease protein